MPRLLSDKCTPDEILLFGCMIQWEDKFYNLTFKDKLVYSLEKNYDKLKQSLVLLGVAVILMAIAGVIEVYLTVPIANFILSIFG